MAVPSPPLNTSDGFEVTLYLIDGSKLEYESQSIPFISPTIAFMIPYQAGTHEQTLVPPGSILKIVWRRKATALTGKQAA